MKISAAIITKNEERNIANALKSLDWADEIIVMDSGSTDGTVGIAESFGARVVTQKWLGFGKQKQSVLGHCVNDWVISIDADETVSPELRSEIEALRLCPAESLRSGYLIPRKTFYMDRPILHSGWYPDHQLRFFNRNNGSWKDMVIHESFSLNGGDGPGRLKGEIHHFSVKTVAEHIEMIGTRYAPLGAKQMRIDGKTPSVTKTVIAAPSTFFRSYFLKLGILDGFPGFCIAMFAAYNSFLKHLLLFESGNKADTEEND